MTTETQKNAGILLEDKNGVQKLATKGSAVVLFEDEDGNSLSFGRTSFYLSLLAPELDFADADSPWPPELALFAPLDLLRKTAEGKEHFDSAWLPPNNAS